jgi:hypothetical protein
VRVDTIQGATQAIGRLARRDPTALAAFIVSLAEDMGPIGEQVRTFIVGDNIAETAEALQERIGALRTPTESDFRGRLGEEIGVRLGFILESIETLVLPVEPRAAFELLVRVFKVDSVAMENCGDHDFEVTLAFERAVGLIAKAAKSLSHAHVATALKPLLNDDGYGVRESLAEVISSREATR